MDSNIERSAWTSPILTVTPIASTLGVSGNATEGKTGRRPS